MPAVNTQFGHPDITIILMCLSYYYGGLTEEQLRVSFELLLNHDDPFMEYAFWIKEYDCDSVPDSSENQQCQPQVFGAMGQSDIPALCSE